MEKASLPSDSPLGPEFVVGDWTVCVAASRLVRGRTVRHLRPLVMDLLVALAEGGGRTLTKTEILDRVWEGRFLGDSVLSRTVAELRRHLGDAVARPRYVETVHKRGYRLVAPVAPVAPSPRRVPPRLAVLPFASLSPGESDEVVAAGMTDALITELARQEGLRVISRQSVLHLRGSERTVPEIGSELGVDAVVEGTTLCRGGRVRVTVQLVSARPEAHLWADAFESDAVELAALQGRIAGALVEAVRTGLGTAARPAAPRPVAVNPVSHLAWLRARQLWGGFTGEGMSRALALLQDAIRADAAFAPAYETLALCWTQLGYWGVVPIREAYPPARAAALRAIELEPGGSDAHLALAFVRWYGEWDLAATAAELRAALALAPSNQLAHTSAALYEVTVRGDRAASLDHLRQALELDPLSLHTGLSVGWIMLFAGELDGAIDQARATLEMYPEALHPLYALGWARVAQRRYEEGVGAFRRAVARSPGDPISLAYLAHGLGRAGRAAAARRIVAGLGRLATERHVPPLAFVVAHAGLGELDEAYRWVERCLQERDSRLFCLDVVPAFEPLRCDPRYPGVLRTIGLGEAAASGAPAEPLSPSPAASPAR